MISLSIGLILVKELYVGMYCYFVMISMYLRKLGNLLELFHINLACIKILLDDLNGIIVLYQRFGK